MAFIPPYPSVIARRSNAELGTCGSYFHILTMVRPSYGPPRRLVQAQPQADISWQILLQSVKLPQD